MEVDIMVGMVIPVLDPGLQCRNRLPLECPGRLPSGQAVPWHERVVADRGREVGREAACCATTRTSTGIITANYIHPSAAGTGTTRILPDFSTSMNTECIGLRLIIEVMHQIGDQPIPAGVTGG